MGLSSEHLSSPVKEPTQVKIENGSKSSSENGKKNDSLPFAFIAPSGETDVDTYRAKEAARMKTEVQRVTVVRSEQVAAQKLMPAPPRGSKQEMLLFAALMART